MQSSGQAVQQDCITSTGTVGGYSVKVQDRVVAYTPTTSIFPVNGIFAVNGFTAGQNLTDTVAIASDGQISWGGGSVSVSSTSRLPGSGPDQRNLQNTCVPTLMSSPLAVPSSSLTTPSAYPAAARTSNSKRHRHHLGRPVG